MCRSVDPTGTSPVLASRRTAFPPFLCVRSPQSMPNHQRSTSFAATFYPLSPDGMFSNCRRKKWSCRVILLKSNFPRVIGLIVPSEASLKRTQSGAAAAATSSTFLRRACSTNWKVSETAAGPGHRDMGCLTSEPFRKHRGWRRFMTDWVPKLTGPGLSNIKQGG